MAGAPLRPDLQELLDAVDAVDRDVESLVAPLSAEQFFWQPDSGRAWGIAQCLEHLAIANDVYGRAIAGGIEDARRRGLTGGGAIKSSVFGRLFVASMEPPVRRRLRAPRKILPRSTRSRDEIMRAFREGHDLARELIRAAATIDVNRATFPNPFIGLVRMRVGTALRVGPAHDRRHVWQAHNVRNAPGFPNAG